MAPRRASKAKAKSTSAPAVPAAESSLVDKAEADDKAGKHRAVSRKRSLEDEVDKALKDNFRVFSDTQLRMVLDEAGKSVFDRVLEAKKARKDGGSIVIGKKFYQDPKDELFADKDPANRFQPPL